MKLSTCHDLDDYLDQCQSTASGEDKSNLRAFEAHLADCPACREAVEQQRRLDRAFAQTRSCLEPVPTALLNRVRQELDAARLRKIRARWYLGSAAAAVIALSVLWPFVGRSRDPSHPPERLVSRVEPGVLQSPTPVARPLDVEALAATQALALLFTQQDDVKTQYIVPWLRIPHERERTLAAALSVQSPVGSAPPTAVASAHGPDGDKSESSVTEKEKPEDPIRGPLPFEARAIRTSRILAQRHRAILDVAFPTKRTQS